MDVYLSLAQRPEVGENPSLSLLVKKYTFHQLQLSYLHVSY